MVLQVNHFVSFDDPLQPSIAAVTVCFDSGFRRNVLLYLALDALLLQVRHHTHFQVSRLGTAASVLLGFGSPLTPRSVRQPKP